MYQVRKRFRNGKGFSCAFRQHGATHSHCRLTHGYEIGIELIFEAHTLNENNWVIDFACMKELYSDYEKTFDHKVVIALDDPHIEHFTYMRDIGAMEITFVDKVGCESFAKLAYRMAEHWLYAHHSEGIQNRGLRVVSCEVSESDKNSALFIRRNA